MGFGSRLRAAMLAAGMDTPAQLAKRCGVSRKTASDWLKMDRASLSAESLFLIATKLNVRMQWLMQDGAGMDREMLVALIEVADALSPEKLKEWLEIGQRMVRPPQRGTGPA